jgi:hypothetical protein
MTQLNLSGRQSDNQQQKPAAESKDESIKNQTVGALGALAMFAAVIVIGSCSRSSKPVAVQQPIQPTAPVSAPAVTTHAVAPAPVVAKAKVKKQRAATLSYVNREYGLSFDFPRNYQLKAQILKANTKTTASAMIEPVKMNFVHPGGIPLVAVEMPGNSYPGTDFKAGLINVSVNPGMTAEQCAQFSSSETKAGEEVPPPVKIGAIDFHEVENSGSAAMAQDDAKYYHVFSNGTCYEFALGIGTDSDRNVEEITPVDRKQVFARLEKILATVKLQPIVIPETTTPASAVATADSPTTSEHTPEPEVSKPNF